MKIEIWSDVMCPFCYMGKRKLEMALKDFPQRDKVELVWHSYQLNPDLKYMPGKDVYTYLAEMKGQTREWSVKMHEGLVSTARSLGLDYRFDLAKIANSFDAHRLVHLASKYHKATEMEEVLYHAYFTEGAVISDHKVLERLGVKAGLEANLVRDMLESSEYTEEVHLDEAEAQSMGISGVPFFLFNRKYAVSGAQDVSLFRKALDKAFTDTQ
jgi:protein disulfide-isomerase